MNNKTKKTSQSKKHVGYLVTTIIIAVLFIASVAILGIQIGNNSKLTNTNKEQKSKIEDLDKQIEDLKKKAASCEPAEEESSDTYSKYDATKIIKATKDNGNIGDHVRGKENSKVIVIEYADLSCPGCATMMPYMADLYKEYGDRVAFVFRHFPIKDHQNSQSAAAAVESAGYQNYYWEMLEAMYKKRSDWLYASNYERDSIYVKIFKQVAPNGDINKFKTDLKDKNIEKKINFDYEIGKTISGVSATPAIYVGETPIDIAREDATFDDIIKDIKKHIKFKLEEK